MPRALQTHAFHDPSRQLANVDCLPVAHTSSPRSLLKQWGEREMKAMRTKGQTATSKGQHATELERRLSDWALEEIERRYPAHKDKLGARDADCTVDIIKSARKRGRLPLRHVIMLAITWGPDFWKALTETADERLAECLRIEAWADSQDGHQDNEGDELNT